MTTNRPETAPWGRADGKRAQSESELRLRSILDTVPGDAR
jgi:hypothetical protein